MERGDCKVPTGLPCLFYTDNGQEFQNYTVDGIQHFGFSSRKNHFFISLNNSEKI